MDIGDRLKIDAAEATVTDRIRLTEGTGEDSETWWITLFELEDEDAYLLEDYNGKKTLYYPSEGERPHYQVTERTWVTAKGNTVNGSVEYIEGVQANGDSVLELDTKLWLEEDTALVYGPEDAWLARASTPAAALARHTVSTHTSGKSAELTNLVPAAAVVAWAAYDTLFSDLSFRSGFWVVGLVAIAWGWLPRRPMFAGSARLVAFGFSLWLLSSLSFNWMTSGSGVVDWAQAESTVNLRALFLLLAAFPAYLLHRKLFFIVGDAASIAAVVTLVIHTVGLFVVCVIDEDFGWFSSFLFYVGEGPWCYLYLAVFAWFLRHKYKDYVLVPMDPSEFGVLRDRVVAWLDAGDLLLEGQAIGDGADDLADAFRLANDSTIDALTGHTAELQRAAKVFRGLGERYSGPQDLGASWAQALDDARVLADDLRNMSAGGQALRVSPTLRAAVETKI